jgi:hypothetical protein
LIAFLFKNIAEKYFKNEELGFNRTQVVEFLYAFDIHCNGFVPFYTLAVVLQFFLIPIVVSDSLFCTFFSNGLFLLGILYYAYVSLLGYYCKKNKNINFFKNFEF